MSKNKQKIAIVEAVLFLFGKAVTYEKIAKIVECDVDMVCDCVVFLQKKYSEDDTSGLSIMIHENTVHMVTKKQVAHTIERMTKKELEGQLTPVTMEVLSIIAYRGPLTKTDIETIRGVNCAFTIRSLVRRGLIKCVTITPKNVRYYQVTLQFLRYLGIQNVSELPDFSTLSTDPRIDAILYNEQLEK